MYGLDRRKILLIGGLFLAIALIVFAVLYSVQRERLGKIEVEVVAFPENTTVEINGSIHAPGTIWLKKGAYAATYRAEGYKTDRQQITITDNTKIIGLILTPESDAAKEESKQNANRIDQIGQTLATISQEQYAADNPVSQLLPEYNIIDGYMIDTTVGGGIDIHESTPDGRNTAVNWMRAQGFEPTDQNITFSDFNNPITGGRE